MTNERHNPLSDLTMADVENTLCESVKYVHAASGDGHRLRVYHGGIG